MFPIKGRNSVNDRALTGPASAKGRSTSVPALRGLLAEDLKKPKSFVLTSGIKCVRLSHAVGHLELRKLENSRSGRGFTSKEKTGRFGICKRLTGNQRL
jgi:hypothetical protein